MNKTFLSKVKNLLLKEKQDLQKQTGQEVIVDTDGDETDEIQGNMLIEMNNQLSTRNSAKLSQIDTALKRIEDNSYGLCLDCGDSIPEKRLLHNPHFQTCVSCAEEREAEEKQRKRF
jgi:RNA polymerase-binding transcription factor DksA